MALFSRPISGLRPDRIGVPWKKRTREAMAVIVQDQSEVIAFLANPRSLGGEAPVVEVIETHISVVFLYAGRVYKLKRAVKFPYLDFSTLGLRRAACEAEVRVNRRTAPTLYRGVVPVTREPDGTLAIGGGGPPVDWLVEMEHFDEETLFDRRARRGELDRHVVSEVAEVVADFHARAEVMTNAGGRRAMEAIADNNFRSFDELVEAFDADKLVRLKTETLALLRVRGPLLDKRRAQGKVRHCHGDLHLRNIFLQASRPALFDAIEFNDAFSNIDVLYDLAFLIMDLDHWDRRFLANVLLNRYLDVTEDTEGLACLPLFLALRASIRAHVDAAAAATTTHAEDVAPLLEDAGRYLDGALAYLSPSPARLVAVGGLSGSGKSHLAREIAPYLGVAPGARVVRSDVKRKRLAGIPLLSRLGPEGYTPEMTERTFRALFQEVREALRAGVAVVADAVFARPVQRRALERIAEEEGVPFHGLWLEAPVNTMEHRVRQRRRNVSDATVEVVHMQLDYDVGDMAWEKVDSGGERDETVARGLAALGLVDR